MAKDHQLIVHDVLAENSDRPDCVPVFHCHWDNDDGATPSWERKRSILPVEEPLCLEINGCNTAVLMRLPGNERELAVGFCLSEGLVQKFEDIKGIGPAVTGAGKESVNIQVMTEDEPVFQDLKLLLVRTGPGCSRWERKSVAAQLPHCDSDLTVSFATLSRVHERLAGQQKMKHISGGLHASMLLDERGNKLFVYEDVGRHNAMDKVIGRALLDALPLRDKIIFNTGRTSYEMVAKAARCNIPVIVSLSSPTSLAVRLASCCGLTILGYASHSRAVVYSCPERIAEISGSDYTATVRDRDYAS